MHFFYMPDEASLLPSTTTSSRGVLRAPRSMNKTVLDSLSKFIDVFHGLTTRRLGWVSIDMGQLN